MTFDKLLERFKFWTARRAFLKSSLAKWEKRLARAQVAGTTADEIERLAHKVALRRRQIKRANRKVRAFKHKIVERDRHEISKAGLRFLIREEGVRPFAYNDPAGHATFGVGHLIHRGPVTAEDRLKWGTPERPQPMKFVMDVLEHDLDTYEAAVDEAAHGRKRKREFDAMVSLAFNIGAGGFRTSTVAREFSAGHKQAAANAFLLWDNPSILRPRREREKRLFLTGQYK